MNFSKLTDSLTSNIFVQLEEKKQAFLATGKEPINLSVGTPDFSPDRHVMEALCTAAKDPENYKYSLMDMPILQETVISWYARRFGVSLDRDQLTSVAGSQEGIAHIAFPICNPGDCVLVPDPGYPIFSFGPLLAGAKLCTYPVVAQNNYLIDFDKIDPSVAHAAKIIIVSYPSNPVCAIADFSFYERLVAFAKKYDIIVIHDNAYGELIMDGAPGISFLSVPGAMDVGIEFNSLSKSYNLTGGRISFALGNKAILSRYKAVRSQIDYGMFLPLQYAAIAALNGPQDILERNRAGYRARRDALCGGLRSIGWQVDNSPATMFCWAPLPKGYQNSFAFVSEMIEKTGVICVPGSSFGPGGEGYVRFALTQPPEQIASAIERIASSDILSRS